jgi:hypothetical protein
MEMVTMLGLEWQWLLCGYWNDNGYYVEESSTFKVLIPLLLKKDKFHVQPSTPSVFSIPPYYCLLSFCCSLSIFLSFCSFCLFFTIVGVVWMCFHCWLSLDHFQIKTLH